MSDKITVYEKCEHGRLEPHGVGWQWAGHVHTAGCKPPASEAKNGYHWSDGCPGGRKIVLHRRRKYWHQANPDKVDGGDTSTWFVPVDKNETVWVEVSETKEAYDE